MKQLSSLLVLCFFASVATAQLGINWTDPVDVAPSSFRNDYPRVVLDGDEMPLITWGGNNKVYFSKRLSSGFTEAMQLNNDTSGAYVATWTGPNLAARNDTIYACFMHKDWGKKTYLVRSFDNGDSFSAPVLIENYADSASRFPTVTIDQTGNPLVGIMKMTLNEAHPQYVVRKSFDYGSSFTEESIIGGWSGGESEACDCCPASIKAKDEKVVVVYRDNLDNIRDIYASVSLDGGTTFPQGFPVDNNQWQIFGCPSSGPDGVIIGDTLYTVFLSDDYCYLSKTNVLDGSLATITTLGASPVSGTQNFPRIDNYNNKVAITWRTNAVGNKIFVAYTEDITNGLPFYQDTVYTPSSVSSDIALGENGLHLVIEDISDGTVKYLNGVFGLTSVSTATNKEVNIYPNPAVDYLTIEGFDRFDSFSVYGIDGKWITSGNAIERIDVSMLQSGSYIIELLHSASSLKRTFVKK